MPCLGVPPPLFSAPALRMMLRQGASVALPAGGHVGDRGQRDAIRRVFAVSLRELAVRYAAVEEALGAVAVPALVVSASMPVEAADPDAPAD